MAGGLVLGGHPATVDDLNEVGEVAAPRESRLATKELVADEGHSLQHPTCVLLMGYKTLGVHGHLHR